MDHIEDKTNLQVKGFLVIRDGETQEVLVEKTNAIHYENMSVALAKSLAQRQDGHMYTMAFGNGASSVSGIGTITYLTPNVVSADADLYNETYSKPVLEDDLEIRHTPGDLYTDIVVTVTLGYGEPSGQRAFDDAVSLEDDYVFDEIALKTFEGSLITHVIFSSVQKSLNRQIEIVYTVRISMC